MPGRVLPRKSFLDRQHAAPVRYRTVPRFVIPQRSGVTIDHCVSEVSLPPAEIEDVFHEVSGELIEGCGQMLPGRMTIPLE